MRRAEKEGMHPIPFTRLMRAFEEVAPARRVLLWLLALLGVPTWVLAATDGETPTARLLLVLHAGCFVAFVWASLRMWWLRRELTRTLQLDELEGRA